MLQGQKQRLHRTVSFADELAANQRKAFGRLWLEPPASPQEAELKATVEAIEEQAHAGRQVLLSLGGMTPVQAMQALLAFKTDRLATEAQRLEALARALTAAPAAPAAPPEPERGGLVGMLRKLAAPASASAPPPPSANPAAEKARQVFEAALAFVAEVLGYVSPRLGLVRTALGATGQPGPARSWPEVAKALVEGAADVGAEQRGWLPPLAKLFHSDAEAVRKAHVALVQLDEASGLHAQAQLVASTLATAPPGRHMQVLAGFQVGPYRASVHPLSHMHLTFRGVPHLETLFPPPASRPEPARRRSGLPVGPTTSRLRLEG